MSSGLPGRSALGEPGVRKNQQPFGINQIRMTSGLAWRRGNTSILHAENLEFDRVG
jgi:hypothetical protein